MKTKIQPNWTDVVWFLYYVVCMSLCRGVQLSLVMRYSTFVIRLNLPVFHQLRYKGFRVQC